MGKWGYGEMGARGGEVGLMMLVWGGRCSWRVGKWMRVGRRVPWALFGRWGLMPGGEVGASCGWAHGF